MTLELSKFIGNATALYEKKAMFKEASEFKSSMEYLEAHQTSINLGHMISEDTEFIYNVSFVDKVALVVTHKVTGTSVRGFVRFIDNIRAAVRNTKKTDNILNYCKKCNIVHAKFGAEMEINIFKHEDMYRKMLLTRLNRSIEISNYESRFGIDGNGTSIEIRNIEGNSGKEIESNLKEALKCIQKERLKIEKSWPPTMGVDSRFDTKECGVHIHMWHQEDRGIVVSAHTIVSTIINSYNEIAWSDRLTRGYAKLFDYRHDVPWCIDKDRATELRTLNCIAPNVVGFAIDWTNKIMENGKSIRKDDFENDLFSIRENANDNVSKCANEILSIFIKRKAVKESQISDMVTWLNKNYQEVK